MLCFYLSLVLLAATPAWSQSEVTPFQVGAAPVDETQMLPPPPVSGIAYPIVVGSEARSNYLLTGLTLDTAYNDNVPGVGGGTPVGDVTYSIRPTITLDQTGSRQHRTFTYSPGFTFYQHTSALNSADQDAELSFQYRLSEHATISLGDTFQKSSNVFNQSSSLLEGTISGSALSPPTGVIAPFANRLSNVANIGFSYQFDRNRMIGSNGIITVSDYPDSTQSSGLNNSNSLGGSAFYSQRLSSKQYIGVTYEYLGSQTNSADAQASLLGTQIKVQTHALLPFYTIYFRPMLSLSLSVGPQHFEATQAPALSSRSWKPSVMASIASQTTHTNFVASYSRTVTGGLGLLGAFNSNRANASVRFQIAPAWTIGSNAIYTINKNVAPSFSLSSPGGHTVSGTVSLQHSMSVHLKAELGYSRLHQSYSGTAFTSVAPDNDRGFISFTYQFTRPLGR